MIRYDLKCENDHRFEGWFQSISAYDEQEEVGLLTCPTCASHKIEKAPMAPAVHAGRSARKLARDDKGEREQALEALRAFRDELLRNSTNVGNRFAEEARAMHYSEKEVKAIHGEASGEEARSLQEEGIDIVRLPTLPSDFN